VTARPPGTVWLVGAGPGDPDLLTVAARRAIDEADVVVHDRLVGDAILATIPPGTLRIDVGKAGYHGGAAQEDINARLLQLVRAGQRVVRLKGGDPFVFGRGGEELLALAAAGVEVRVVPGLTSGLAGPATYGIPVTQRGIARSVVLVTGHAADHDDPSSGGPDWDAIARVDTIVVYMAGRTAPAVAARLIAAGRAHDTPVALVTAATTPRARIEVSDLAGLERRAGPDPEPGAGDAVLLVVGEVVGLRGPVPEALRVTAGGSCASIAPWPTPDPPTGSTTNVTAAGPARPWPEAAARSTRR
jgi:uroporphyrin-III C-methyltransferase